ncbi:MAG: GntR family transcriptional regulator [Propionibacteriaceae bacterium]|jgi:DNA-binding GntR family transcriptional regulator|nr:GntR family transcriptional regulator [Propionibacteriaceae bacterium]
MAKQIVVTSVIDAVTADLRSRVLERKIIPGSPITEQIVAEQYGVARATAKAAIERLVAGKVLTRTSHKTAKVVTLGPDDVRDIYNTRIYLESEILRRLARERSVPEACRIANQQIAELWSRGDYNIVEPDMRYHTTLVKRLNSPRTSTMYGSLAFEVKLCMSQLQGTQQLSPQIIVAEHAAIMESIKVGDGEGAAKLLDEHLSRARELLASSLGGEPGPAAFVPPTVFTEKWIGLSVPAPS